MIVADLGRTMGMDFRRIMLDELPRPLVGCHAVAAGDFLFVGGLLPSDYRIGIAEDARSKSKLPLVDDPARAQSEYLIRTAETILTKCGSSFDSVVRIDQFVADRAVAAPYLRARREAFANSRRPASTLLAIAGLPVPAAAVSADIVAVASGVQKDGIFTNDAPINFPGVPHGAQAGPFVFVQGQIATDFVNRLAPEAAPSPFWYETPIERETEYIIRNLATILEAAGSSLSDIVKAHVYLTNMADFAEFERVWARYFSSRPPARTVIPVASLGSQDCRIEINVIALHRDLPRKYINTVTAGSRAPLIESEAVYAGNFLFLSGLIAGDFRNGLAPEAMVSPDAPFFASEIEQQVGYALKRAAAICDAAGGSLDQLCWSQIFLSEISDYYNFTRAWNEVLGEKQPAVTTVQVPNISLAPGARIVLDLTAYVPERTAL